MGQISKINYEKYGKSVEETRETQIVDGKNDSEE